MKTFLIDKLQSNLLQDCIFPLFLLYQLLLQHISARYSILCVLPDKKYSIKPASLCILMWVAELKWSDRRRTKTRFYRD